MGRILGYGNQQSSVVSQTLIALYGHYVNEVEFSMNIGSDFRKKCDIHGKVYKRKSTA